MSSHDIYGDLPVKQDRHSTVSKEGEIVGFDYPLGNLKGKGYFQKVSGKALIKNNIRQLLNTKTGERVMRPDFGSPIHKYVFEPLDYITKKFLLEEISEIITRYEPRVNIVELSVEELDKYGTEGLQALIVNLNLSIKDEYNSNFDITVEI